jgi:ATP-dependent helicase/nuclease subunit A
LPGNALPDSGAIDLLFRVEGGWRLVDFKTDDLKDEAMLEQAVQVYNDQIKRYQLAATKLLEEPVHSAIVFLDAMGGIRIVEHTEMEGG